MSRFPIDRTDPGGAAGQGTVRAAISSLLRGVMEAVVLLTVFVYPWLLGGMTPFADLLGFGAVALLLTLWGARVLVEGQFTWKSCPVVLTLAVLFLFSVGQLTPLPRSVLRTISPATSRLYDELLPPAAEVVRGEPGADASAAQAGSTISLYPGATHDGALRLLAAICLFVVVRNNVASPSSLRRLAWVALATGTALSFFGLIQYLSSEPGMVYWIYPTQGVVFGPFVCRNDFAFHVNLCIGLSVGLLLAATARTGRGATSAGHPAGRRWPGGMREAARWLPGSSLLQQPRAVWIMLALALMIGCLVFCQSRGGVLAAAGGVLVCLVVRGSRSTGRSAAGPVVLVVVAALALVVWFGQERIWSRWSPTLAGEVSQEARVDAWARVLPLTADFPLWGTGLGTFQHVELPRRDTPDDGRMRWDHAHNEYVEALIEGGAVRLALSLLAVFLVATLSYRAYCRYRGGSTAGLVLGGIYAFATVAVHSFVDWGLQVPAITVLAAVLCAQLSALGGDTPILMRGAPDRAGYTVRLGGLGPVLAAGVLVPLALVLYVEGQRIDRVERFRDAALALAAAGDPDSERRQLDYLEVGLRAAPNDAFLHEQTGRAHALASEHWRDRVGAAAVVTALATPSAGPNVPVLLGTVATTLAGNESTRRGEGPAADHRRLALRHYLQARNACPLLSGPHVAIALDRAWLQGGEPASAYWRRARQLKPWDAELLYLCGLQELTEGNRSEAWADWRRSLALSDRRLAEVLGHCRPFLNPDGVLREVLPDRPALLVQAAAQLFPGDAGPEGQPFLARALDLLAAEPVPADAADIRLRAWLYRQLGKPDEAVTSYRLAIARSPGQLGWRYEYAQLLQQQGQLSEARQQLETILDEEPRHPDAVRLFNLVLREMARKR